LIPQDLIELLPEPARETLKSTFYVLLGVLFGIV
jgi:hypothetical protein